MVTKHGKGHDRQERCGDQARLGFNGQAQIRSNVDGLFYFFFVVLLLPTVVRAQETPLNPLEEAQKAKPAEGKASRNRTNCSAGGARTKSGAFRRASPLVLDHTDLQGLQ